MAAAGERRDRKVPEPLLAGWKAYSPAAPRGDPRRPARPADWTAGAALVAGRHLQPPARSARRIGSGCSTSRRRLRERAEAVFGPGGRLAAGGARRLPAGPGRPATRRPAGLFEQVCATCHRLGGRRQRGRAGPGAPDDSRPRRCWSRSSTRTGPSRRSTPSYTVAIDRRPRPDRHDRQRDGQPDPPPPGGRRKTSCSAPRSRRWPPRASR